ncbi:hypothetical protein FD755_018551, partial [Muntiacus reevesi]
GWENPLEKDMATHSVFLPRKSHGQRSLVFTYKQSTITHQKVMPMHPMDEEGVDDMATLTELHGGAIMHNLYQRYKRDQIY